MTGGEWEGLVVERCFGKELGGEIFQRNQWCWEGKLVFRCTNKVKDMGKAVNKMRSLDALCYCRY